MDFDIPFLSRMRGSPLPEMSPWEAMKHLERTHNAARRSGRIKVVGTVTSPVPIRMQDRVLFEIEADGIPLKVWVPEGDASSLAPGARVVVKGRLLIEATNSSLGAVLKGHLVQTAEALHLSALQRKLPKLKLADFLAQKLELVILGSERAIHDLDEQLKVRDCYPGPVRREIVRMSSSLDVLAAVRRYSSLSQGILFVRRGGEASEFSFWSDPGFISKLLESRLHIYIGLGHAEQQTALDTLVDELFPTPMDAGVALAQALLDPPRLEDRASDPEPVPPEDRPLPKVDEPAPAKPEFYPSNVFIWTLAFGLGALVIILGLW